MRVTKTDFIFAARGGERSAPHGLPIPEDAIDLSYDPEAMEITYTVPADPEVEGSEPVLGSLQMTQEQIDDAEAAANAPAPPAVPESVTPRQIRLALIDRGIMPEQITAMLEAIEDAVLRAKSLAEWEFASAVRRDHPLIAQLGGALQFTSADVDDLFREAKAIGE